MKDMLTIIYEALLQNSLINEKITAERIGYYVYGEDKDHTKTFMIIEPLGPPLPGVVGSDKELNVQHTFQIDVQGTDRKELKVIQKQVKAVMLSLGYGQLPEGLDEWLPDVKRYVDARRYRGLTKLYDTDY
ncbi:hypothetical protein [Marinilactibacillus psychrotolerans]|uniref:hypothetical protein n=1 Tax=Marinilactibacillus psychrotolerans TaxID=191770 RepID=UPI0039B057A3